MISAPELHAMLKGWPVEARPLINGEPITLWRGSLCTGVSDERECEDWRPVEEVVDLACMAGIRYLMRNKHWMLGVYDNGPYDGQTYLERHLGYGDSDSYNCGPTLLHAVDGAVRGGKG